MRRDLTRLISGLTLLLLVAIALVLPGKLLAATDRPTSATKLTTNNSRNNAARAAVGTSRRGGVTISPAFQQITLRPDLPSQTFDFSVTNNSSHEYEFALSVVDFGSLDETGGVLFVGNAQKALSYRYALSPWVTLEKDRVVVAPHTTEKVPITLINKESLTPGGHYGAVLVTPTDTGDQSKKVQIDQVASSLLFVKKQGGEVYKLDLNNFTVHHNIFSLPMAADLRFQNAGNVHVTPRGLVTLTDSSGRIVKRGVINTDSGIVLPESFRSMSVPLQTLGPSWWPGRYTITAAYRYDDVATVNTEKISFFYISGLFVASVIVVAAVLLALVLSRWLRRSIAVFCKIMYLRVRAFISQIFQK